MCHSASTTVITHLHWSMPHCCIQTAFGRFHPQLLLCHQNNPVYIFSAPLHCLLLHVLHELSNFTFSTVSHCLAQRETRFIENRHAYEESPVVVSHHALYHAKFLNKGKKWKGERNEEWKNVITKIQHMNFRKMWKTNSMPSDQCKWTHPFHAPTFDTGSAL